MVVHVWAIRPEEEEEYDCQALYSDCDNLFSIRLHHGGKFVNFPGRRYANGKISYIDVLDIDLFSVIDMNEVVEELGYDDGTKLFYHFQKPDCLSIDNGLHALGSDQDVHVLSSSPQSSKVVIEEIVEPPSKTSKRLFLEWHEQVDDHRAEKGKQVEVEPPIIEADHEFINFNPFADNQNTDDHRSEKGKQVDDEHNEGSESDDSDYMDDSENEIYDVHVDMRDFHLNVDKDSEFIGACDNEDDHDSNEVVDVGVIDNDDFESGDDSGDDIENRRARKIRQLQKQGTSNVGSTGFYVGQVFSDSNAVKDMIKRHSVETRRELKIKKNDKLRVRAICMGTCPKLGASGCGAGLVNEDGGALDTDEGSNGNSTCPWTLLVSKVKESESWQVKTYLPQHKCLQSRSVKACTSLFLAKEIVQLVDTNPTIPVKALQEQLQKKYQVNISRMKACRAKIKAIVQLNGDYMSQYEEVRDYCMELMRANPDSTIKIDVEPSYEPDSTTRQFRRIYVCLGALKNGFKASKRELLGLDGSFMKGPFPGQILIAVALDANNGIYHVAYAIVEAETTHSWTWFLQCIGDDLALTNRSIFTFISDRQKGILPAVASVFPSAEHRYCLRHIHENFKLRWKGKAYKDILWKCATAPTVQQFQVAMNDLKALNEEAWKWLAQIQPHHWARSHFSGRAKSDLLLNNICEVFNRQLVDGRDKPIITALEYIREYCMRRIVIVQTIIEKCDGPLTPTATKLLEKVKKDAGEYTVVWNGGCKYQVSGPWMDQCVVDT